eukprot:Gregarina_sp_Pseudo_9__1754@NODE_2191_length_1106_cov_2_637301_g2019_i0_p1_GENE_NODE_2191_length_1106_cov_2_637301_g2019_i0NODE_2191_length_1106_cov_2_637301_g2019_i0_p1_ORF_typecomplete_len222_score20_33_NODE_2191_length_1106_cov_2_637301_g2019_i04401105
MDYRNEGAADTNASTPEQPENNWQDPVAPRSPTRKLWIEKAIADSPIGRFGITRGIGFLSAAHLGMVGVPDFLEIPVIISKTAAPVPTPRSDQMLGSGLRSTFASNLLSPKPLTASFNASEVPRPESDYGTGGVLLKHFILVVSSSHIVKFVSLQEMVTFIYHQVEHKHVSLEGALRLLCKHLRRVVLQNKISPLASALLKEEMTFLCIPLQIVKISRHPA